MDKYRKEVRGFVDAVKGGHFFCFDTETTGLSPVENDIIQFTAIRFDERDGEYVQAETLDTYINPGYPIPEKITEITGITDEMVKNAPTAKEAAVRIKEFLGEKPNLMGYNSVSFDQSFLDSLYRKTLGIRFEAGLHLDVLIMAREKMPKPHKLIDMATAFGVADGVTFHSSLADADATFKVFTHLLPMYDKEEPREETATLTVTGIKRWRRSDTLDRIYVNNSMNLSVYYDIPSKKWEIAGNVDDADVIRAAYAFAGVTTDEEFCEKYV